MIFLTFLIHLMKNTSKTLTVFFCYSYLPPKKASLISVFKGLTTEITMLLVIIITEFLPGGRNNTYIIQIFLYIFKRLCQKSFHFIRLRVFKHLFRSAVFLNNTVSHKHNFISNITRKIHLVSYNNHCAVTVF